MSFANTMFCHKNCTYIVHINGIDGQHYTGLGFKTHVYQIEQSVKISNMKKKFLNLIVLYCLLVIKKISLLQAKSLDEFLD